MKPVKACPDGLVGLAGGMKGGLGESASGGGESAGRVGVGGLGEGESGGLGGGGLGGGFGGCKELELERTHYLLRLTSVPLWSFTAWMFFVLGQ
jgi:hypothetical protein